MERPRKRTRQNRATTASLTALAFISTGIAPAFAGDPLDSPNIHTGDTAPTVPEVGRICEVLRNASEGRFIGKDGKDITFTHPSCTAKSRRERNAAGATGIAADGTTPIACQQSVTSLTAAYSGEERAKKIDELCKNGSGSLNQEAAAYCVLRTVAQTGQATQYCEAYESADKAQKGTTVTLALDVAAAVICWSEYLTYKAASAAAAGGSGVVSAAGSMGHLKGACGGAALAAGMGELVQTASVLIGKKNSSGDLKIDSDHNVQDKKNLAKVLEVIASSALSLKALQIGVCYYSQNKDLPLCRGTTLGKHAKKIQTQTETCAGNFKSSLAEKYLSPSERSELETEIAKANETKSCTRRVSELVDKVMSKADRKELAQAEHLDANMRDENIAKAELAHQAAILFTGLAVMRGSALTTAASTKKKSKEILQSMFQPNGEGAPLGLSGMGNVQQNIYAATGGSTYVPPGAMPVRAGAVSREAPEAFMLPNGSPIAAKSERLGSQIPPSRLEEAAAAGASGIGGMIASAATAAGAKGNLSEIRSVTSTMFANLPQDLSGGYAGGGGRSVAAKGTKESSDMNLKSLFGAEEGGEGEAQGAPELTYREPAGEDIWHSKNPKGHNLFQIVSDKYDTVQRKSAVGSDL